MLKEYINTQTKEPLNMSKVLELKDNAMLKHHPELWEKWDFSKNEEFNIYKITKGSGRIVHWYCDKCKVTNRQMVKNKTKGAGCPTCRGYYPSYFNNLTVTHPEIAEEFHPTKNGDKTAKDFSHGSEMNVWWLGKCGHEWDTPPSYRMGKGRRGCPYCVGKRVSPGINSLSFTHPELVNFLLHKSDGDKYTKGSDEKIFWNCECGNIFKKQIHQITSRGFTCPRCKDGISSGEKMIYTLLKSLGISFKHDSSTDFSEGKRYDFIFTKGKEKCIIEVHGEQHFVEGKMKRTPNSRHLKEEVLNDKIKREQALENGVDRYYEIKKKSNDYELIKREMYNSGLMDFLEISKEQVEASILQSQKSLVLQVCKYYNNNSNILTADLSGEFNLSEVTIKNYLKLGNKLGICVYNTKNSKFKKEADRRMSHQVVQISMKGEFIAYHHSIKEAVKTLGYKRLMTITDCCKGNRESAVGFKWMYIEDYNNLIHRKTES